MSASAGKRSSGRRGSASSSGGSGSAKASSTQTTGKRKRTTQRSTSRSKKRAATAAAKAQQQRQQETSQAAAAATAAVEEEESDGTLYCLCRQPNDPSRFMLACDRCSEWYHGECVNVSEIDHAKLEAAGEMFLCPLCKPPPKPARRPRQSTTSGTSTRRRSRQQRESTATATRSTTSRRRLRRRNSSMYRSHDSGPAYIEVTVPEDDQILESEDEVHDTDRLILKCVECLEDGPGEEGFPDQEAAIRHLLRVVKNPIRPFEEEFPDLCNTMKHIRQGVPRAYHQVSSAVLLRIFGARPLESKEPLPPITEDMVMKRTRRRAPSSASTDTSVSISNASEGSSKEIQDTKMESSSAADPTPPAEADSADTSRQSSSSSTAELTATVSAAAPDPTLSSSSSITAEASRASSKDTPQAAESSPSAPPVGAAPAPEPDEATKSVTEPKPQEQINHPSATASSGDAHTTKAESSVSQSSAAGESASPRSSSNSTTAGPVAAEGKQEAAEDPNAPLHASPEQQDMLYLRLLQFKLMEIEVLSLHHECLRNVYRMAETYIDFQTLGRKPFRKNPPMLETPVLLGIFPEAQRHAEEESEVELFVCDGCQSLISAQVFSRHLIECAEGLRLEDCADRGVRRIMTESSEELYGFPEPFRICGYPKNCAFQDPLQGMFPQLLRYTSRVPGPNRSKNARPFQDSSSSGSGSTATEEAGRRSKASRSSRHHPSKPKISSRSARLSQRHRESQSSNTSTEDFGTESKQPPPPSDAETAAGELLLEQVRNWPSSSLAVALPEVTKILERSSVDFCPLEVSECSEHTEWHRVWAARIEGTDQDLQRRFRLLEEEINMTWSRILQRRDLEDFLTARAEREEFINRQRRQALLQAEEEQKLLLAQQQLAAAHGYPLHLGPGEEAQLNQQILQQQQQQLLAALMEEQQAHNYAAALQQQQLHPSEAEAFTLSQQLQAQQQQQMEMDQLQQLYHQLQQQQQQQQGYPDLLEQQQQLLLLQQQQEAAQFHQNYLQHPHALQQQLQDVHQQNLMLALAAQQQQQQQEFLENGVKLEDAIVHHHLQQQQQQQQHLIEDAKQDAILQLRQQLGVPGGAMEIVQ